MNHAASRRISFHIILLAGLTTGLMAGCHKGRSSSPVTRPAMSNDIAKFDLAIEADARKTLTYLSSDELEGRGLGTHGLDLAADYIAGRFESLGLKKVPGQSTYFQSFDYPLNAAIGAATTLTMDGTLLEEGKSFVPIPISSSARFDGDVVFVGYGISEPEQLHYDDYDGIDVKGKVVLAMRFEPSAPDGNSRLTGGDWSSAATFAAKAATAKQRGAAALLIVNPPSAVSTMPATTTPAATTPATTTPATTAAVHRPPTRAQLRIAAMSGRNELVDFDLLNRDQISSAKLPVVQITEEAARQLLQHAGAPTLRALQQQIDETGKPASSALEKSRVSGRVAIEHPVAKVKNVIAVLPGKGPHAEEYVVVGAHYDHLGRGMLGSLAPGSHEIHHGADDNGSGTTAVIQLATKLAHGKPLERSILFISFTAEEEGLIGSDYFVKHPTIPLAQIVAMLNLDMVGRLNNEAVYIGGSGTAESFAQMLKAGDENSPLKILYTGPEMGRGGMGPSDHETFAKIKIPVLFFFTGLHRDYHRPSDTVDKINFDGMTQILSLADFCIHHMATMPREPYIDRYDQQPGLRTSRHGATLGISPASDAVDDNHGVKVGSVLEQSAAAKAGILNGDVIVQLNDSRIDSIYDLTDVLREARPGDPMKAIVRRQSKVIELYGVMGGAKPATTRTSSTRMSATSPD